MPAPFPSSVRSAIFIAKPAALPAQLRRSGMGPRSPSGRRSAGARIPTHAAPTELGGAARAAGTIKMALLTELDIPSAPTKRAPCSHASHYYSQPQRGCITVPPPARGNPVGVDGVLPGSPRVARASQPWAECLYPVGVNRLAAVAETQRLGPPLRAEARRAGGVEEVPAAPGLHRRTLMPAPFPSSVRSAIFIAKPAALPAQLRRSGMGPRSPSGRRSAGARIPTHAAPTELGGAARAAGTIKMALLTELDIPSAPTKRAPCSHASHYYSQPQRGCITVPPPARGNPVGVDGVLPGSPRVARASQPWAECLYPVGVNRLVAAAETQRLRPPLRAEARRAGGVEEVAAAPSLHRRTLRNAP